MGQTNDQTSAIINPQMEMAKQTTIHSNLRQEIICTTKDKLHLSLQNYEAAINAKGKVATYGGIALSLLLALVTSSTKDMFGLSADAWRAIFIVLFIISGGATIHAMIIVIKTRKDRDIGEICRRIMDGHNI